MISATNASVMAASTRPNLARRVWRSSGSTVSSPEFMKLVGCPGRSRGAAYSLRYSPPGPIEETRLASSVIPKAIHQKYDWIFKAPAMQIVCRNAGRPFEVTHSTGHSVSGLGNHVRFLTP